jgi:serine/threonine protein kinase
MIEWIIFIVIFFLYIHIINQYKSSEEADIYEYDYVENINLQETCNMLQPFVFKSKEILPPPPSLEEAITENPSANLYIYDDPKKDPIQIPNKTALELMAKSLSKKYYTEHNQEFIQEMSDFKESMLESDPFLRPSCTIQSVYDVMVGTLGANTPMKYHVNTRKFMMICGDGGKVAVKMTPWKKNRKHLHEVMNYERGEYRSAIDVWNSLEHNKRDLKKIEFVEFEVDTGNILFIPPYWGYSIQYQSSNTYVLEYTYSTIFNRIAFLGEIGRTFLQQRNIYHKVHRTIPNTKSDTEIETVSESVTKPELEPETDELVVSE